MIDVSKLTSLLQVHPLFLVLYPEFFFPQGCHPLDDEHVIHTVWLSAQLRFGMNILHWKFWFNEVCPTIFGAGENFANLG